MSDNKLMKIRRFLKHFTVEQRIKELGLRPDRADVIIPALDIYLRVMKWSGIRRIYVPQVGLADGIVRTLYAQYKSRSAQSRISDPRPTAGDHIA
jgi:exopolyphosphatase/guanosine-5'-triphosphate,3'-diphosphate pyrophosphatase